jgi:hypothetical protein
MSGSLIREGIRTKRHNWNGWHRKLLMGTYRNIKWTLDWTLVRPRTLAGPSTIHDTNSIGETSNGNSRKHVRHPASRRRRQISGLQAANALTHPAASLSRAAQTAFSSHGRIKARSRTTPAAREYMSTPKATYSINLHPASAARRSPLTEAKRPSRARFTCLMSRLAASRAGRFSHRAVPRHRRMAGHRPQIQLHLQVR